MIHQLAVYITYVNASIHVSSMHGMVHVWQPEKMERANRADILLHSVHVQQPHPQYVQAGWNNER